MKRLLVLLTALLLSGCAFGHRTSYEGRSDFNIKPQNQKIIVAVHDMRPYVQNNEKSPDYTGRQKSIAGVPYNVSTASGKPLADDFGRMIVNTMLFRNVSASQQEIPYTWSFDEFKQKVLGKEKNSKVFYIKMTEWITDAHFRTTLGYDLKLTIFDGLANEVANNQEKGYFFFDESQPGKENLSSATSDILGKLFAVKELDGSQSNEHKTEGIQKMKNLDSAIIETDSSFSSLPPKVKDEIKNKCSKDYPEDFALQATCANKQASGWLLLNK